jgi:hypothetical protein
MRKYRILEKNGLFYPQYRNIFWPFYSFFEYQKPFDVLHNIPKRRRFYYSLGDAKEYIAQFNNIKIHPCN